MAEPGRNVRRHRLLLDWRLFVWRVVFIRRRIELRQRLGVWVVGQWLGFGRLGLWIVRRIGLGLMG